jgi:seryl-tRNA synthetase
MRAERNKKSKGKPSDEDIKKMRELGEELKKLEASYEQINAEYNNLLIQVPNLTHSQSPIGGEADYKVLFETKIPKPPKFELKNHEELMLQNDLIDFERGAKVTASKFYFLKNKAVRLNMALLNYGIDIISKYGYTLLETPDMAKDDILEGIGFNPRGNETQVYSIENQNLSLIGTAEITVGGYHANEIIDLSSGPKKYMALSHCFRTEAGAYGKTSKGLYRVHQFTKLEMFIFCKPEESEKYHQEILEIEKRIIGGLKLPYRVIDVARGDLGGPAYRKFDIEAWMVMNGDEKNKNGGWGEITSCSNCTDYQARRLNIKYRDDNGELKYVHTINGTGIVLSRFPLAIIENYQDKNGSICVPRALQKYAGFKII